MNCPNCSYEMDDFASVCPQCGLDPVLFVKTNEVSNTLYNRGLAQAKVGDLSGAIDSLERSIDFNKNNIHARNLIGLVYFEIGCIGDALKHWVISSSLIREDNLAVEYLNIIEKNSRTLEKYNDAVKAYNQALEYLYQKSDDMAIIQLKKAIEMNPKFISGMNLLTLCYFIQKNKEKAQALVERVLSIDVNNTIALNYYRELFPSKIRPEPVKLIGRKDQGKTVPLGSLQPKDKKSFGETFRLGEMVSFLIGALCAFGILYILVIPGMMDTRDKEINRLKQEATATNELYEGMRTANEEQITKLEEQNKQLTQENQTYAKQASLQDRQQKLETVETLKNDGQNVEAAELLSSIDTADLPADAIQNMADLKEDVYPAAAKKLHADAVQAYNTADYAQCKALLDKCEVFAPEDASYMDSILYYRGLLAEEAGLDAEAKTYYEKLLAEYPSSTLKTKANNRLNALQAE